jgi:Family of unknown function (DUF6491)
VSWLEWRRIVSGNKSLFATLTLVLTCLTYAPAGAQAPGVTLSKPPAPKAPVVDATTSEARIPFANQGGIYNWRAVNDRTLLIQAQNRQWFKATLFAPCIDLPFAERVGFESNADGSFDKFSSVQVRKQKCPLLSLVPTDAPPKGKSAKAATATAPPATTAPAAATPH